MSKCAFQLEANICLTAKSFSGWHSYWMFAMRVFPGRTTSPVTLWVSEYVCICHMLKSRTESGKMPPNVITFRPRCSHTSSFPRPKRVREIRKVCVHTFPDVGGRVSSYFKSMDVQRNAYSDMEHAPQIETPLIYVYLCFACLSLAVSLKTHIRLSSAVEIWCVQCWRIQ